MFHAKKLKFKISATGGRTEVTLAGGLDEAGGSMLTDLRTRLEGKGTITFDCADIAAINSVGLRLWVQFLESIDRSVSIEFRRCSTYFIDYANMAQKLVNGARITSFHVPYRCASCAKCAEELVETSQVDPANEFKPVTCRACGGQMAADVEPAAYLSFMSLASDD